MSLWMPYWQGWDNAAVAAFITRCQEMHMQGVVMKGIEWDNSNGLPSDLLTKLDMFKAAGITPYVGLWMGQFDSAEDRRTGQVDGGQWPLGRAIIDAEDGWVNNYNAHPTTASSSLTTFAELIAQCRLHQWSAVHVVLAP